MGSVEEHGPVPLRVFLQTLQSNNWQITEKIYKKKKASGFLCRSE